MKEDKCTRCGKIIQLFEPYQEDDKGNTTHIYPERYCKQPHSVYCICMSCNHLILIILPDWNEPMPLCPKCGKRIYTHSQ